MENFLTLPHKHSNRDIGTKIANQMPSDETIGNVANAMRRLGDSSRLRIFWLLCHTEECVTDIAQIVKMSSPAVSHHLRVLKDAGLIVSRRYGKEMLYRAADTKLVDVLHKTIEKIAAVSCPL